MRILGIDPGSRITGLGIVEVRGRELKGVASRSIRLQGGELSPRLGKIYQAVNDIIEEYEPDLVAVEQVFMSNNAKSALTLGHARGAAICAAVNLGKPVSEYSAKQIKSAVVGTGGASKEQVQHMVRVLLGLTKTPQSDAADALACAICHLHSVSFERKLGAKLG